MTYDSPPDCHCFDGSGHGTRVYGFIANVLITSGSNVAVFPGDARVSCAVGEIVVARRGSKPYVRRFPGDATIMKVFSQAETSTVFNADDPSPFVARKIRNGSMVLLRTL